VFGKSNVVQIPRTLFPPTPMPCRAVPRDAVADVILRSATMLALDPGTVNPRPGGSYSPTATISSVTD
jgi:hypothetical protein